MTVKNLFTYAQGALVILILGSWTLAILGLLVGHPYAWHLMALGWCGVLLAEPLSGSREDKE